MYHIALEQPLAPFYKNPKEEIPNSVSKSYSKAQIKLPFEHEDLPLGENKCLPLDIVISHIFPHLSVSNLHHFVVAHPLFLRFLKLPHLLNQLFANPKINHIKLVELVGEHVTHLRLMGDQWQNERFISFIQRCSNLVSLNLFEAKITDCAMYELTKSCPNLTQLDVEGCIEVKGMGVFKFSQGYSGLKSLNVSNTGMTDLAVQELAGRCRHLISLNLSACDKITNVAIFALAQSNLNLLHLNLKRCYNMTDKAMCALATRCSSLMTLHLKWCDHLTDKTVKAVAQNCPNLATLSLGVSEDWITITDAAIQALAQGCRNLTSLDLAYCHITDAALFALAQNHVGLIELDLSACQKITDEGIRALIEKCPNLRRANLKSQIQGLNRSKELPIFDLLS